MKKNYFILIPICLLILICDVVCDTTYTHTLLREENCPHSAMAYDGSFVILLGNSGLLNYFPRGSSETTTLATAVPRYPFILYQTDTLIFDKGDGKYTMWGITTSTATNKNTLPDLGKKSTKMFYFYPDPTLYILHDTQNQKLNRYDVNPTAGTITAKADHPSFDFGIGNLAFIEKTDQGFLGVSATKTNGYYPLKHISSTDGSTIKMISTYFTDSVTGLSYSPSKQKFYVTSGTTISVWDINDFTKPVFRRSIADGILKAVFSYSGDFIIYQISNNNILVSPVAYHKEIDKQTPPEAIISLERSLTNDFYARCTLPMGVGVTQFISVTSALDGSCVTGLPACYCNPTSNTPYLNPLQGTCVDTCPNSVYLGTCLDACPSGSKSSGNLCFFCPNKCTSCTNSEVCSQCDSSYYLFSTSNTSTYELCLSSSLLNIGYVATKTDTDGTGIIKKCPSGCLVCANERKCIVCSPKQQIP